MANITPASPVPGSANVAALVAASAGGDTILAVLAAPPSTTNVLFIVNNGSGSSINVTFAGVNPCSQGSTHNVVQAVAAGQMAEIVVPAQCIASTGNVGVTYSAVTTVTVGAVYMF